MSTNRLRWLLVVVIIELLAIIGLVVWAVTKTDTKTPEQNTTTTTSEKGTLTSSLVGTGFNKVVTDIASVPIKGDKRLFVVERVGTIKIIDPSKSQDATPFLDISSKVLDDGEMGLLGLTFHPKFSQNGFFYVNYVNKDKFTVIARFSVTAEGVADPSSEKDLLKVKQPYPNHNAGGLAFGPDGFLYIPLGDGGSGGDPEARGQNKAELLGKMLRIDVDNGDPYAIPASNPFVNEAGTKPEIWATGLRNPWRIAFDKLTGDLYIADVGQDKIEEVDLQLSTSTGGENYGWRCYEGTLAFNTKDCQDASKYTPPIFEYSHENGRCSITGGYVYHGTNIPSLEGSYIYGDLCSGEIFSAKKAGDKWEQTVILKTPYTLSTFGQDTSGELYLADTTSGAIYRLDTH